MKSILLFFGTIFCLHSHAQTFTSNTFKLQELKKILDSSVVVGLGEVGHGFESINETKAVLVGVLHSELNYEAIAFESSFTESIVGFMKGGDLDARTKSFLYPFWNTPSVKKSLQSFFEKEKFSKPLIIGFDIQEDCRFNKLSEFLIDKNLISINKGKLDECDSILSYYIGKQYSRKSNLSNQEYLLLIQNYELIETEINAKELDSLRSKLVRRSITNRKWLCKYLTLSAAKEKMYYRDSLMAENVKWIQNELYPTKKLIIWAADSHIAKKVSNRDPLWMGEWLSWYFNYNYYSISFQKGTGDTSFIWPKTSYKLTNKPDEKFNLIIYLDRLKKIKDEEWRTPCD